MADIGPWIHRDRQRGATNDGPRLTSLRKPAPAPWWRRGSVY